MGEDLEKQVVQFGYHVDHLWSDCDRMDLATQLVQLASGSTFEQLLADYPYLELDDIRATLAYAAWMAEQRDLPLQAS